MPKRLIICCDGTWQSLDSEQPTNVRKTAQLIAPAAGRAAQIIYYDAGVGAEGSVIERLKGGAFGRGLDAEIRQAYRFLALNYEPGDKIWLFGFSRGAYTVRSLAGLILASGVVRREALSEVPEAMRLYRDRTIKIDHPNAVAFRQKYGYEIDPVPLQFLGCWDTVGALGVPRPVPVLHKVTRGKYAFHDIRLGYHIEHARHAVAIDERRKTFPPTLMEKDEDNETILKQQWFPGDHGAVGGGSKHHEGLSDGALLWMLEEAEQLGLQLMPNWRSMIQSRPTTFYWEKVKLPYRIFGLSDRHGPMVVADVAQTTQARVRALPHYRPLSLRHVIKEL